MSTRSTSGTGNLPRHRQTDSKQYALRTPNILTEIRQNSYRAQVYVFHNDGITVRTQHQTSSVVTLERDAINNLSLTNR